MSGVIVAAAQLNANILLLHEIIYEKSLIVVKDPKANLLKAKSTRKQS